MSSPPVVHRSWVEVSRQQIAANYRAIRNVVGPEVEVMPVVKADAYRHGAVEVSRILEAEGAGWLAVSNVEEGIVLRQAGIRARILVMADFLPGERDALIEFRLTPVIHQLPDVAEWNELITRRGGDGRYHLKIDSGMGRLGTRASAGVIIAAIEEARAVHLEGLMTHFASAANYATGQTSQQLELFSEVRKSLSAGGISPEFVHMSSSIPVAYGRKEAWGNMVRPGHAMYGYVSAARGEAPGVILDVAPALTWKAAVLSVKDVPQGALIGYGGICKATHPMRIAVLAAGYADGIPHRLSNRGKVIVAGQLAPIIGAVSMDLTTIDVTNCSAIQPGDAVIILGVEGDVRIDAQEIARVAGTISYSVLCGISARVKRVYV